MKEKDNDQLGIETFIMGIEYLEAFYVTFKIDMKNKLVQQIWRETFINLSNLEFTTLIKNYCINNVYAPTSPASLIEHYKKMFFAKIQDSSIAFNNVLLEVRKARYVYSEVENLTKLELMTLKECEVLFEKFRGDTSYQTYLFNGFKVAYEKNSKLLLDEKMENGILQLDNKKEFLKLK